MRPSLYQQEAQFPIEGAVYTIEARWSVREERWYLDVYDEEREPLYLGIAVVLNFPLGVRSNHLWPGMLVATDTSGENREPAFDDFGSRVRLVYFTAEELA